MLQLLQQLFSQIRKHTSEKRKHNSDNCQILTTQTSANKGKSSSFFTIKTIIGALKQKSSRLHGNACLATKVPTICLESGEYWPKEKYFQMKSIKEKHQQQHHLKKIEESENNWQSQKASANTSSHTHNNCQQLRPETIQSQLPLRSQLLQKCDKTLFHDKLNLTTTKTQMAHTFLAKTVFLALAINIQRYIYKKVCYKHNKFSTQFLAALRKSCSNSLNSASFLKTRKTDNSTLQNFLLRLPKTTAAT